MCPFIGWSRQPTCMSMLCVSYVYLHVCISVCISVFFVCVSVCIYMCVFLYRGEQAAYLHSSWGSLVTGSRQ